MKTMGAAAILLAAATIAAARHGASAPPARDARERRVAIGKGTLWAREIGQGPPIVVLHGGPDFDTRYLLPGMDRLADSYRLVYYDQRGRGKSADGWQPEDVTIDSEMTDLDRVRAAFGLDAPAILGHSFGAILALEYAIRHPERVSRLILMDPAPVSTTEFAALRADRLAQLQSSGDLDRLRAAASTQAFKDGDPDAVAAYYRIHFTAAVARRHDLDTLMLAMRASFTKEGVLKARAIEDRLDSQTIARDGYDLLAAAGRLRIPTLVLFGDHDFVPVAVVEHIARTIPGAQLLTFANCGHFPYLECPGDVHRALAEFFTRPAPAR